MENLVDLELVAKAVEGSNALSGITSIDMSDPGNRKFTSTHFGAMAEAYVMGREQKMPTAKALLRWHSWIVDKQKGSKHISEKMLEEFITELSGRLSSSKAKGITAEHITFIAATIKDFYARSLFSEGNARMARLILNYLAGRFIIPLIVFSPDDREVQELAETSQAELCRYLARKMRDFVFDRQGQLMQFSKGDHLNGLYVGKDGSSLIVQWGHLIEAETAWLAAL